MRFITLACLSTAAFGFSGSPFSIMSRRSTAMPSIESTGASPSATTAALNAAGSSPEEPTPPSSDWESQEFERSNLDKFLSTKYPDFYYAVFDKTPEVAKVFQESASATVFCPSAAAWEALGAKKRSQLIDPRNLETVQKVAAFHVVAGEAVPATALFQEDWTVPRTAGGNPELSHRGVATMGGPVAVSRTKSGGFLGLAKTEDGGVMIGPEAKIVQSFIVGKTSIVHEVDALVSPYILWRFFDQLRIPFVG